MNAKIVDIISQITILKIKNTDYFCIISGISKIGVTKY